MTNTDLLPLLAEMPLFHDLSPEQIATIAAAARVRDFPVGAILFLEEDPGDIAYVVISGIVDMTLGTSEGDELLLHRVERGGYFGEMALLDGNPRSATARVMAPSSLLCIARDDFTRLLRQEPDLAITLLRFTVQRLRRADEKIKALGFQGVAGRLARTLLTLDSEQAGPGVRVQQQDLANMIASRRPTVSTLLSEWRALGHIETSRGRITIMNRSALEELAEL